MQISFTNKEKIVLLYILGLPLIALTILYWIHDWWDYRWLFSEGDSNDPENNDLYIQYITIAILFYYVVFAGLIGLANVNEKGLFYLTQRGRDSTEASIEAAAYSAFFTFIVLGHILQQLRDLTLFLISPWRTNNQLAMEKASQLENRLDELSDKFFTRLEVLEK